MVTEIPWQEIDALIEWFELQYDLDNYDVTQCMTDAHTHGYCATDSRGVVLVEFANTYEEAHKAAREALACRHAVTRI